MQRARVGPTEMLGDIILAFGVPIILWNDASPLLLVIWGAIIGISSYVWAKMNQTEQENNHRLTIFGWFSTIVWAALPWILWSSLDDRGAVWILVFVVCFAIAADTVFVTQTSSISIDEMVLVYAASYLIAFALHGELAPIVAVITAAATFVVGGAGLGEVAGDLVTKRVESELRTRRDDLTGIGNRAAAVDATNDMIARHADEIYCAFFDMDDFKQLNDNYGYDIGDAALCAVAQRLVELVPDDWTVARFGGDEFVAVGATRPAIGELTDIDISLPTRDGLILSQPVSVGLTSRSHLSFGADELFLEAASALRIAKRKGKRQVVVMSDELRAVEAATADLESRLVNALERREIVPWGQPIVELHSGRIVGIELLARWPQADGTVVMPNDFVPVIESQGNGPSLGLLMIGHAIEALARPEVRDAGIYISVNLSAKHLFHRRLPAEIRDRLELSNVNPEKLVLEITESQHLPSSAIWGETARQLRAVGVGLAIDDFGTGYSSMAQLLSMPFTHLKIDRVMTQATARPGGTEMAAAIIAIAVGSGMVTIIEGIENEIERQTMQAVGGMYGQGYLFARPAELDDVISLTVERSRSPRIEPRAESHQMSPTLYPEGNGSVGSSTYSAKPVIQP